MRHAVEAVEAAGGHAVPGDGPYPCNWSKYGSLQNRDTNIGQVHVADRSGVTDEYTFIQEDDSTLTVGLSFDPSTNYSADGSITLTDSLGSTGRKTWAKGALVYVQTLIYYQRYKNNGAISCPSTPYQVRADHAAGNVGTGSGTPASSPWGNCTNDPNGSFRLEQNSGWSLDRGRSATVNGAAMYGGLDISASTGFTSHILEDYEASATAGKSYVCGSTSLPDVPIIYNTG